MNAPIAKTAVGSERFGIEHRVLRLRIAPGTKLVWLYLRMVAARGKPIGPMCVKQTASDLGLSVHAVNRALGRLESLDLIHWSRSPGGTGTRCGTVRFLGNGAK